MDVTGFRVTLYTNKGQTEEIIKGLKMEVGRNVTADLPIMANGVSRAHLHVSYKDEKIIVTDLASTNGTYISGARLQANKSVVYEPGKRISLGQAGCFLRIEVAGPKQNTDSEISKVEAPPQPQFTPPPTNQVSSVVFTEKEKEDFREETKSKIRAEILEEVSKEAKKEIKSEIEKNKKAAAAQVNQNAEKTSIGTVTGAKNESQFTQDTGIFNVFANAVATIAGPSDSDARIKKKAHKYIQNAEKLVQQRKKEAEAAIRNGLGRARAQAKDIVEQAKKKSIEINDLNSKKIEKAQSEASELKRDAQKYVEKIRIENAKLEERISFLKKDISEYQENYSAKEQKLKELQKMHDNLQVDHDKKMKSLNSVLSGLEKDIEDKQRGLDRLNAKNESEIQDHQLKLEKFDKKYQEFNSIYKSEQEAFEKLKLERNENEEKVKAYHNEFLELEKQSNAKKISHKKVEDKLERAIEHFESEMAEMDATRKKSQKELDEELQGKLSKAQNEAHQILQSAQNEAERLREELYLEIENIKSAANEESQNLLTQSRETADNTLRSAKRESDEMLSSSRQRSEELLSSSQQESEELLVSSKQQSEELLSSSRQQSEELLSASNKESKETLARAKEKENSIDKIVEGRLEEISQKEQEALSAANQKLEDAKRVLVEETNKAQEEAKSILANADAEKEDLLSGLKQREKEQIEYFENEREKFHNEIKSLRSDEKKTLESELAEFKVGQMREIDVEAERKKSLQNEFKKEQADVWAKGIGLSLQNSLIKKFEFVAEDPVLIREEIERVAKSILIGEVPEEQEEIRKLMNFDPARIKKVKKYWRNAAIMSVLIISGLAISPHVLRTVKKNVVEKAKSKKDASQKFVKEVEKKRQEERRFETVKVDEYKKSYTDRVLYTKDYVENELSKEYREEWSLNLDTYFVETLRLSDNAIFTFISKESILIQDLQKLREKINAKFTKEGIKKMTDLELAFEKDVKSLLKTEGKYMMFTDFKKDYYKKAFNPDRVPANK